MKLQYNTFFWGIFASMVFAMTSANAQSKTGDDDYKDIYLSVDTPAKYIKSDSILNAWLIENTIYPQKGTAKNINVLVQLTIEKDGTSSHPKVLIPNDSLYDEAAIQTAKIARYGWIPAKYKNENVRSYYYLTIKFDSITFETVAKIRLESSLKAKNNDDEVYVVVEQQGEFPNGPGALYNWIKSNLEYPKETPNEEKVKVIIRFVIEKDGSITNATVIRGYSPAFDKAALDVVAKMPKWIPGKQRNNTLRSYFTLPIVFSYE